MKTIGLIGGMSWESSLVYYEIINQKVKERLGGFHSAKSVMLSVDFDEIEKLQAKDDWKALDKLMLRAAKQLESAGVDLVVLCTNTMHQCSEAIVSGIEIPFIHIADATGEEIVRKNCKKVALLGTKFTMERDFYKDILQKKYGIEVIIPSEKDRNCIHHIIFQELVSGIFKDESREVFQAIIESLENQGAEGVILGCTEIPLLITEKDVNIQVFDTTRIHAEKAVEIALKK